MRISRSNDVRRAVLAMACVVGLPALGYGQTGGGSQSLSSGSGEGTGTGTGAGAGINSTGGGTGNLTGGGSLRPGVGIGGGGIMSPDSPYYLSPDEMRRRQRMRLPQGSLTPSPGALAVPDALPTDPGVPILPSPSRAYPGFGDSFKLTPEQMEAVQAHLLNDARAIKDPADRALALDKTARTQILSRDLKSAHVALEEAARAALDTPVGLIRDLRLMAVVTTYQSLAHEFVQAALINQSIGVTIDDPIRPLAAKDRMNTLLTARDEWRRAAYLAASIGNINFRSENLYWVIDSEAKESQAITDAAEKAYTSRQDLAGQGPTLLDFADQVLVQASGHAAYIPWPIWRDRALSDVAQLSVASNQYARALEIARAVPDPEIRTDALIRTADGLARHNFPQESTLVYMEAARAVSQIPLDDTRRVLAGVLIDSLISTGRFDDARASVVLVPDATRKLVVLGAIALSQGRRGQADAARRWIAHEAPEVYRSLLNRKVDEGVLLALDQVRTQTMNNLNMEGEAPDAAAPNSPRMNDADRPIGTRPGVLDRPGPAAIPVPR
jgi:hypothetical protein